MLAVSPFVPNQRCESAPYVSSKTLCFQSYEGVRMHLMLAVRPFVFNHMKV